MSKYRIQRHKTALVIDVSEDNNSVVSSAISLNGLLREVIVVVPDLDSTNTVTLVIKDVDGYTLYTSSALAKSATTLALLTGDTIVPVSGAITLTLTTSGNQTADRTFSVVLLIER